AAGRAPSDRLAALGRPGHRAGDGRARGGPGAGRRPGGTRGARRPVRRSVPAPGDDPGRVRGRRPERGRPERRRAVRPGPAPGGRRVRACPPVATRLPPKGQAAAVTNDRYLASTTGSTDFVARHGLWDDRRQAAADALAANLESVDFVRVVFGDPHGIARSKTVAAAAFRTVLRNGLDCSPGPFVFDTGHAVGVDFFADGGGIGIGELTGAGDFIVVPDPLTFRMLPHTHRRTGWVIADEYLRSGA